MSSLHGSMKVSCMTNIHKSFTWMCWRFYGDHIVSIVFVVLNFYLFDFFCYTGAQFCFEFCVDIP